MYFINILKYKTKKFLRRFSDSPEGKSQDVVRRDVIFFPIGVNAELEVYWKKEKLGCGPAIILHVLGFYVLRFDCFGYPGGHAHIYLITANQKCESRIFLPEKTIEEQIDRALFEMSKNLDYWMQRHYDPTVRKIRLPNKKRLNAALEEARESMLEYRQKSLKNTVAN
jgi:hypothetical protein